MSASRSRSGRSHPPGPGSGMLICPVERQGLRRQHREEVQDRMPEGEPPELPGVAGIGELDTRSDETSQPRSRGTARPSRRPPGGSAGCGCRRQQESRAWLVSSSRSSFDTSIPAGLRQLPVAPSGAASRLAAAARPITAWSGSIGHRPLGDRALEIA